MDKKLLLYAICLCLKGYTLSAQAPEWEYLPSPDGGLIKNFDLDGSTLYGLTASGIYHSEDEGFHWQILANSLGNTRTKSQLRVDKGILYAFKEDKLVRSDDQGKTWLALLQAPFPLNINNEQLQQLFVKGDTVLVGSQYTIYRSTDRGATWASTIELDFAEFISIFEFKNEIFAAQDRYIYRSSDGGATWDKAFTNAVGYSAVTATDSFLLAFYAENTRMIRSTDGLRTWKSVLTDTIADFIEKDPYGGLTYKWVGGFGNKLYFFQNGDSHYFCPILFCYSDDAGSTWHRGNNGQQANAGDKFRGGINFGAHILLASSQLYHSLDSAQSFFPQNEGLEAGLVSQIFAVDNHRVALTDYNQIHHSHDNGQTWAAYPFPDSSEYKCRIRTRFFQTKRRLFKIMYNILFFNAAYSEDGGLSWQIFETNDLEDYCATTNAFWYKKATWVPTVGAVYTFWKLDDQASNFQEISFPGVDAETEAYGSFSNLGENIVMEHRDNFFIFNEKLELVNQIEKTPCNASFPNDAGLLSSYDHTLYNFCADRTFILPPNETDWQEIYPQDWTTGIPLYHSQKWGLTEHNGVYWALLQGKGLFYATDHTGRFYPVQPQMPYPYPTSIAFDETHVLVGTDGGGIWTYPLAKTFTEQHKKDLFKVFPNPSQGELNLQADAFIQDEIALSVLDASGRRLFFKTLTPGQYWNLNVPNLPKGLYFLQMRTETEVFGLKWVVDK